MQYTVVQPLIVKPASDNEVIMNEFVYLLFELLR